jgi:hypothetical protein
MTQNTNNETLNNNPPKAPSFGSGWSKTTIASSPFGSGSRFGGSAPTITEDPPYFFKAPISEQILRNMSYDYSEKDVDYQMQSQFEKLGFPYFTSYTSPAFSGLFTGHKTIIEKDSGVISYLKPDGALVYYPKNPNGGINPESPDSNLLIIENKKTFSQESNAKEQLLKYCKNVASKKYWRGNIYCVFGCISSTHVCMNIYEYCLVVKKNIPRDYSSKLTKEYPYSQSANAETSSTIVIEAEVSSNWELVHSKIGLVELLNTKFK